MSEKLRKFCNVIETWIGLVWLDLLLLTWLDYSRFAKAVINRGFCLNLDAIKSVKLVI